MAKARGVGNCSSVCGRVGLCVGLPVGLSARGAVGWSAFEGARSLKTGAAQRSLLQTYREVVRTPPALVHAALQASKSAWEGPS